MLLHQQRYEVDLVENDKPTLLHQAKVKLNLANDTVIEGTVKGSTASCTAPHGRSYHFRSYTRRRSYAHRRYWLCGVR